jgi:uncharacterized membrane protein YhhN
MLVCGLTRISRLAHHLLRVSLLCFLLSDLIFMFFDADSALKVARLLGRNWPLVLLIVMIGALFWPTDSPPEELDEDAAAKNHRPRPNGHQPHETYH